MLQNVVFEGDFDVVAFNWTAERSRCLAFDIFDVDDMSKEQVDKVCIYISEI